MWEREDAITLLLFVLHGCSCDACSSLALSPGVRGQCVEQHRKVAHVLDDHGVENVGVNDMLCVSLCELGSMRGLCRGVLGTLQSNSPGARMGTIWCCLVVVHPGLEVVYVSIWYVIYCCSSML